MKINESQLRLAIRKALLINEIGSVAAEDNYGELSLRSDNVEKFGSALSKSGNKYYIGDTKTGLSGGRLNSIIPQLEQFVNKEYPELGLTCSHFS